VEALNFDLREPFRQRILLAISRINVDFFDGRPEDVLISERFDKGAVWPLSEITAISGQLSNDWWVINRRSQPGRTLRLLVADDHSARLTPPERVRPLSAHAVAQGRLTIGTTVVRGPDVVAAPGNAIAMIADAANTGNIFVGADATVTTVTGFPLTAGSVLKLSIDNLSDVWFIASIAGQHLRYIVEIFS